MGRCSALVSRPYPAVLMRFREVQLAIVDDFHGALKSKLVYSCKGLKQGAVLIHDILGSFKGSKEFWVVCLQLQAVLI